MRNDKKPIAYHLSDDGRFYINDETEPTNIHKVPPIVLNHFKVDRDITFDRASSVIVTPDGCIVTPWMLLAENGKVITWTQNLGYVRNHIQNGTRVFVMDRDTGWWRFTNIILYLAENDVLVFYVDYVDELFISTKRHMELNYDRKERV